MAIDKYEPNCIKTVRKTTPILRKHRYTNNNTPFSPPPSKMKILQFSSPDRTQSKPRETKIQFHGKVRVFFIPSRNCYPESIQNSMWSRTAEIKRNARRNAIEFAAEGWDWRRATEDEAMYLSPNGERIHPVHFQNPNMYPRRL